MTMTVLDRALVAGQYKQEVLAAYEAAAAAPLVALVLQAVE
jgi:hypothetical protein